MKRDLCRSAEAFAADRDLPLTAVHMADQEPLVMWEGDPWQMQPAVMTGPSLSAKDWT